MSNKQLAVFMGFSFGLFCLTLAYSLHTRQVVAAQNRHEEEKIAKFKAWANNVCANGFSEAQLVTIDNYKVVCR